MRFPHTVAIKRSTQVQDGPYVDQNWIVVTGAQQCWVQQQSGRRVEEGKTQMVASMFVFFPGSADVQHGDHVVFGDLVMDVKSVIDPTGLGHHLEAVMEVVK